jgi:YVTN family beta-propeller protein
MIVSSFGVPMSVRVLGGLVAAVMAVCFCSACGQVYRPVVIPCTAGDLPNCPVEPAPTPSNFHSVLGISTNAPEYAGTAMQIDVSGDAIVGETATGTGNSPNSGFNPTNIALAPGAARVFVTTAGSVYGGVDAVASFFPIGQTQLSSGLGAVTTTALPPNSEPVFVGTTQATAAYIANFNTNTVSTINTTTNVVTNTANVGKNPVALAEMPNALKLYVANQGDNTVSSLNAVDLTPNLVTGFTGITPIWVIARDDNQKVYVLTQGDGQLVTIDTATDTVTSSLSVGTGANFMFYDTNFNRIYVTDPGTSSPAMLYVFSATGGPNDTPLQLAAIPFGTGSAACPLGCTPVSVTALLDGSRFYVASYESPTTNCPDSHISGACIVPQLTVFNANSFAEQYPGRSTNPNPSTMTLLTWPPFSTNQYAVPPVASCVPTALYTPTSTRFRMFTVSSEDSTRVFVSMCDAGTVAVVDTTDGNTNNSGQPLAPDTLVTNLVTPLEVCSQTSCRTSAPITSFSITGNVVTFQGVNSFVAGQTITIEGLSTGTYLNGATLTVLATGLSGTQFECYFSNANVGLTSDSGTATPSQPLQSPIFMVMGQ